MVMDMCKKSFGELLDKKTNQRLKIINKYLRPKISKTYYFKAGPIVEEIYKAVEERIGKILGVKKVRNFNQLVKLFSSRWFRNNSSNQIDKNAVREVFEKAFSESDNPELILWYYSRGISNAVVDGDFSLLEVPIWAKIGSILPVNIADESDVILSWWEKRPEKVPFRLFNDNIRLMSRNEWFSENGKSSYSDTIPSYFLRVVGRALLYTGETKTPFKEDEMAFAELMHREYAAMINNRKIRKGLVHISLTTKDSRLGVKFPTAFLPNHGTAVIFKRGEKLRLDCYPLFYLALKLKDASIKITEINLLFEDKVAKAFVLGEISSTNAEELLKETLLELIKKKSSPGPSIVEEGISSTIKDGGI